jgi:hypothetical protein
LNKQEKVMTEEESDRGKQKLWYLRREGKVNGPFPAGSVRRFLLLGRVRPGDDVSFDKKNWRPVLDVPEVVPPEIRKAATDGTLHELLADLMREDERTGRERRSRADDIKFREQRKGERREDESEVLQRRRKAKTELRELGRQRKKPYLTTLVVTALVVSAIGYGFYLGSPPAIPEPDCRAAAAPGVNWRNCRLEGVRAESMDLSGALLNNAVLRQARFSGSRFSGGDLRYADFTAADLSYADLKGSAMKGASLRKADLTYADLTGADLSFVDLQGARLGGANLGKVRLDNAIWTDGKTCKPGSIGKCVP